MIAKSLQEVGAARSIVIDEHGVVLAGNGTVEGAQAAGIQKVKVVDVDGDTLVAVRRTGLTDAQKRRLALFDNRTGELAEWDADVLTSLANEDALDVRSLFSDVEWSRVLASRILDTERDKSPSTADARNIEPEYGIAPGDVFACGPHRVMCGDSASREDVAVLMDGRVADVVFTSPPYAQQRDYEGCLVEWNTLMSGVSSAWPINDKTQIVINLGIVHRDRRVWEYWRDWFGVLSSDHGLPLFGWYVWDQGSGLMGDWGGRLAPSFEFLFHFTKTPRRPEKWIKKQSGGKDERALGQRDKRGIVKALSSVASTARTHKIPDSVVRVQRQRGRIAPDLSHPAPFSVELPMFVMATWPGVTYEPFGGSGSTVLAGHRLGLPVYAMEIAPKYCHVAITRWERESGLRAHRVRRRV